MSTSKKISGWKLGLAALVGALALTAVAAPASAYEGRPSIARPVEGRGRFERRTFGPLHGGREFARGHERVACAPNRGRVWEGRGGRFGRR